jgi:DmsE family decaheme c-type cytochrome
MKRTTLLAIAVLACALASPAFADDDCAMCHDDVAASMQHQIHMRIDSFEVGGRTVGCAGCHGDGEAHMEDGDPALIRTFASAEDNQACIDCHQNKHQAEWMASTHALEGMTCTDCHSVHVRTNPLDTCKDCHQEVYAQFELPNHHPVRQGKMSCVSCHDPHSANEAQLNVRTRLNDLCYDCHQGKEGPFIFEHEPVVEDCRLCHVPHGSVADNLLTANEPMLCLQCHELHFHAALISPEGETEVGGFHRENHYGTDSMTVAFTSRCSQCHSQIHGTDLPSQTLTGGGHGMVR